MCGCAKHVPSVANEISCSDDIDCVIRAKLDPKNNCCGSCESESININAEGLRQKWYSENCKGLQEDNCPTYDCYEEKLAKAICKNNLCDIEWTDRK